jgi:REP element-mobilizing transposase RayT
VAFINAGKHLLSRSVWRGRPRPLRIWSGAGGRGAPHNTPPHTSQDMPASLTPVAKYRYRRRLPHLQQDNAAPVRHILYCRPRRLARGGPRSGPRTLREQEKRIHLYAVVVMSDHVHLLFVPLREESGWPAPLVEIMQCLKGATAHRINQLLHRSGPVWEEESFDHVLRSDESVKQKCEYIRQNPVKAGLVQDPENYGWLWVEPGLES